MDDFQNELNELQGNFDRLDDFQETHDISFAELFTDDLMLNKTKFENIDAFFESLNIEKIEDFENLPKEKLNAFVDSNSDFSDWDEMYQYAVNNYLAKQAGFDFD